MWNFAEIARTIGAEVFAAAGEIIISVRMYRGGAEKFNKGKSPGKLQSSLKTKLYKILIIQ